MMGEKKWSVETAVDKDVLALALIGAATFLETFAGVLDGEAIVAHCQAAHSPVAYQRFLENGAEAWLAKLRPGQAPIGFAMLSKPDIPGAGSNDIELKRIYTLSRFHGIGVGAALMETALAAATSFERVVLGVYAKNQRAIAFYQKLGFSKIDERRFNVGGTLYDDIVLARPVKNQQI